MARYSKGSGEMCIDEIGKAAAKVCADECSRKFTKVFLVLIISHLKYILTSGFSLNSFKEFLLLIIIKYQKEISPKLKSKCLFEPSCSNYAIQCIQKYGAIKGTMKTIFRIMRCSPLTERLPFRQIVDLP